MALPPFITPHEGDMQRCDSLGGIARRVRFMFRNRDWVRWNFIPTWPQVVAYLMRRGGVQSADSKGFYPIHWAVQGGKKATIKVSSTWLNLIIVLSFITLKSEKKKASKLNKSEEEKAS